ncbi:uncharacterized protein LOC120840454 [Ixodes scapularis]|uniref:uncharacterized protein LOC120840454 n=1 Tax=Ixodes scapularis TaxID=6945 RepID=UPI001A9F7E23|nr:uncharacterized protein LOC120840454 [Ixodes scapularis]
MWFSTSRAIRDEVEEVEFLRTEKGKEALILDGFKYCFQRKDQDEKTAWRCAKYWTNNCKAAVLRKHGKVVKTTQEHNHPPDSSPLRGARLKNALKQKVRSEPHLPAPQVYSREILSLVGQVDDTVMAELPTFESVRSTMCRE